MAYIKRDMENTFLKTSEQFKAVLVTGPRQVGKTTISIKVTFALTWNEMCAIYPEI